MSTAEEWHREGIAKSWPARAKAIRGLRATDPPDPMTDVTTYNARKDRDNDVNLVPWRDYSSVGAIQQSYAIANALEEAGSWQEGLAQSLSYVMFADRLYYFWHDQFEVLFPKRALEMMNWELMTSTLACNLWLDWQDAAIYQGYLMHATLNRGFQLRQAYENQHRRAQAFMIRLFADWRADGTGHEWPNWAREVPVYERLLQRWRTSDSEEIRQLLLVACDRHTHESRFDTETKFFDFGDDLLTHTPLEILMVQRLRQLSGLANPTLDHPLMAAPFDVLPTQVPVPAPDELMRGTLARVQKDWPNFQSVTSLPSLKKWAGSRQ